MYRTTKIRRGRRRIERRPEESTYGGPGGAKTAPLQSVLGVQEAHPSTATQEEVLSSMPRGPMAFWEDPQEARLSTIQGAANHPRSRRRNCTRVHSGRGCGATCALPHEHLRLPSPTRPCLVLIQRLAVSMERFDDQDKVHQAKDKTPVGAIRGPSAAREDIPKSTPSWSDPLS
ncbi:hypothetical protein C8R44DRAFT_977613 [Mycena epipterygia]|nr:hypothetical protein C8R44DRAFT_977613 [Mycena epipterygia]